MTFKIVIPARYESTRLPGKPLLDIAGKPLVQHVWERACESGADEIIIATDDEQVLEAAEKFHAEAMLTGAHHQSGTDRIAEVATLKNWPDEQIIVNLQGDEPMMPAELLDTVASNLASDTQASMATVCKAIENIDDYHDPHCVKVVFDRRQHALYFSRAPIPFERDETSLKNIYRHIGLYAYRVSFLRQFTRTEPCELEQLEKLEQLRALYSGKKIHVAVTTLDPGIGVDTEADLEAARRLLEKKETLNKSEFPSFNC